jgi:hypothetical protein
LRFRLRNFFLAGFLSSSPSSSIPSSMAWNTERNNYLVHELIWCVPKLSFLFQPSVNWYLEQKLVQGRNERFVNDKQKYNLWHSVAKFKEILSHTWAAIYGQHSLFSHPTNMEFFTQGLLTYPSRKINKVTSWECKAMESVAMSYLSG